MDWGCNLVLGAIFFLEFGLVCAHMNASKWQQPSDAEVAAVLDFGISEPKSVICFIQSQQKKEEAQIYV